MKNRLRFLVCLALSALAVASCGQTNPQQTAGTSSASSGTVYGGVLAGEVVTNDDWNSSVARTLESVVKVDVTGCGWSGSGSGFYAADVIVTNRHVVEGAARVTIHESTGETHTAQAWGSSKTDDLAWISIAGQNPRPSLTLARDDVIPGDLVAGIGYPLGGRKTVERGRVVEFRPPYERASSKTDVILMSNETLPGDSGGPLIDTKGSVVGVVFAMDFERNLSMALRVTRVTEFLAQARDAAKPKRCRH